MSRQTRSPASQRFTVVAIVLFALLTVAVVASQARSAQEPAPINSMPATPAGPSDSLLVVRLARSGLTLCREWLAR